MKRSLFRYKKIFGLLVLLVSIAFFIFWEAIGRKELMYEEIVVFNQDVFKGTIVQPDMLTTVRISAENIMEGMIKTYNNIIGLEVKQTIPQGFPVSYNFLGDPRLVLNDDEKIMKLPQQWVYSVPETLRRGDDVYIYAIKNDGMQTISINSDEKLYIFNTTVAYVKNSSNQEVQSIDQERLAGTSPVNSIEIIIRENEFNELEKYISQGYYFILMYQ